MSKWLKLLMVVMLVSGIGFVGYMYMVLNGNPLIKVSLKEEAQEYLDEKYNQEMVVEKGTYNFNIGYGAKAYPLGNPNLVFQMYCSKKGEWTDRYAPILWEQQLKEQIYPIMEQQYPKAKKKLTASFSTYESKGEVPYFTKSNYSFMGNLSVQRPFSNRGKISEHKKIYTLINYWKKHDLKGGIKIRYKNDKVFRFNYEEIQQMNKLDDIEKYGDFVNSSS